MIYFSVYLPNGDIVRTGSCPSTDMQYQAQAGELVMEGVSNPESQWVVDGVIVDLPPAPGGYYVFNYSTKAWEPDIPRASREVDQAYKGLLSASDWTQLPDVNFVDSAAWAAYRQELRDIPNQPGYPMSVIWPTAPAG